MNWKEEAKRELRAYAYLKESLPNIRSRLEGIRSRKISLKSSVGDPTPVQGGGNHYEDRLLDLIVEEERLKHTYRADKIRLGLIERGLQALTDSERQVLEIFAENKAGRAVDLLRDLTGYEQAQIYRIYGDAIYKFTLAEYGIPEF